MISCAIAKPRGVVGSIECFGLTKQLPFHPSLCQRLSQLPNSGLLGCHKSQPSPMAIFLASSELRPKGAETCSSGFMHVYAHTARKINTKLGQG